MRYFLVIFSFSLIALAEKTSVKLDGIDGREDTSITIKKGATSQECVEYHIVESNEEVFGDPDFDKSKAYANWKNACDEWKKNVKELNKGNSILSLNCNRPISTQENEKVVYKSEGKYKVKTKMKELAK